MATNIVVITELCPLVVDLDGTLTPTDTLIESLAQMLKANPISILAVPKLLFSGPAALKEHVAAKVFFSATLLPYREEFLNYLRKRPLSQ